MTAKMAIRPNDNWRWYFDENYDCLMLEIASDMVFRSRYPAKMLTPDAFNACSFSVDDATTYYRFHERCAQLALSEPQRVELALNAVVASNFLKPLMPKSWYFTQQPMLFLPTLGMIVEAQIEHSRKWIDLLIVEEGGVASLCLVAKPNTHLLGKAFYVGDAIKIMNDRLVSKQNTRMKEVETNAEQEESSADQFYLVCS